MSRLASGAGCPYDGGNEAEAKHAMQMLFAKRRHVPGIGANFCDLMELYESNYIALRNLIPDIRGLGSHATSVVWGCLDLEYRLIEHTKYTSTFSLTYSFNENNRSYAEPNLEIRMYHDARLVEVLSAILHKHRYRADDVTSIDNLISPDNNVLQSKWMLNRFLHKWLAFCLNRGHVLRNNTKLSESRKVIADLSMRI